MPRLQATVPQGAPANALLRVRLPDGQEVKVRVPDGLKPGDDFQFQVSSIGEIKGCSSKKGTSPPSNVGNPEKSKHASSKNPKKKKSNHSEASSFKGHPNRNRTPRFISLCLEFYEKAYEALTQLNDKLSTAQTRKTNHRTHSGNTGDHRNDFERFKNSTCAYLGSLDREIVNGKDFCAALAVGMFIGSSIVLGFLAGVLWVTPLQ